MSTPPQRWGKVLWAGLGVYMTVGVAAFFAGLPLWFGLMSWLIGPEATLRLPNDLDRYEQLPAAARALYSSEGIVLCGLLSGVPLGLFMLGRIASAAGEPAHETLGLKWPTAWQGLSWGLLILVVSYGCQSVADKLGVSRGAEDDWQKILHVPLLIPLIVAFAVLWPIFDEVLFRGFILEGLRQSRLGETRAILLTSFIWATMHSHSMGLWGAFLVGLTLAFARLRTGSTYLTATAQLTISLAAVIPLTS